MQRLGLWPECDTKLHHCHKVIALTRPAADALPLISQLDPVLLAR